MARQAYNVCVLTDSVLFFFIAIRKHKRKRTRHIFLCTLSKHNRYYNVCTCVVGVFGTTI